MRLYTRAPSSLRFFSGFLVVTHRLHRAHRAAHPGRFPLSEEIKKMYPALKLVETSMQSTPVHLQVYDGMLCSNLLSTLSESPFFIRCGSCPSDSFSIHDTWKVLLPRDGFICRHVTNEPQVPPRPTRILTPSGANSTMDHGISASLCH